MGTIAMYERIDFLRSLARALALFGVAFLLGCPEGSESGEAGASIQSEAQERAQLYLDVALEAEAWIASTEQRTAEGVAWPDHAESPEVIDTSLYHGTPGIVLFYLELHRTTGEKRFLETAVAGARDLAARIEEELAAGHASVALHGGLSGVAFVLAEAASAADDETLRDLARRIFRWARSQAQDLGAGIGWIEPMPFSEIHGKTGLTEVLDMTHGATGIGLAFLYAAESGLLPEAKGWARAAGDRLLEMGEAVPGGLQWQMVPVMPIDFNTPNFSHGTAGVAYFLARLYEVTGDARYLQGALAGAERLKKIATVREQSEGPGKGTGRLIYHHEGAGENRYYLSWCHGPVGTGRLFHQLAKVTGDESWNEWLFGGLIGIQQTGAPELRSEGFWNNISQCCGDAGVGELSLSLYAISHNAKHLAYAERIGHYLDQQKTAQEHGVCWIQAEHRSRPEFLKAHTGYMQGAAGVGSYLLRLHAMILKRPDPKLHWPDSPFG